MGTLSIPSAPVSCQYTVSVEGVAQGTQYGAGTFGPILALPGQLVSIQATGLANGVTYTATLVGTQIDARNAPSVYPQPLANITQLTGPITATISGPVTVTGTVSIGNTPSVTISGTPSVTVTSGTVSISGTPSVTIASGTVNATVSGSVSISSGTVNVGTMPAVTIASGSVNATITGSVSVTAGTVNVQNVPAGSLVTNTPQVLLSTGTVFPYNVPIAPQDRSLVLIFTVDASSAGCEITITGHATGLKYLDTGVISNHGPTTYRYVCHVDTAADTSIDVAINVGGSVPTALWLLAEQEVYDTVPDVLNVDNFFPLPVYISNFFPFPNQSGGGPGVEQYPNIGTGQVSIAVTGTAVGIWASTFTQAVYMGLQIVANSTNSEPVEITYTGTALGTGLLLAPGAGVFIPMQNNGAHTAPPPSYKYFVNGTAGDGVSWLAI